MKIAGVVEFSGRPATDIAPMLAGLQRYRSGAARLWSGVSATLGEVAFAGTGPQGVGARDIVRDREAGIVIVADARIDNRAMLRAQLRSLGLEVPVCAGDAGVILAAYRHYGEDCARHLLGDFAFAIFDERAQRLFCARDAFGIRPFYYHHRPGDVFAWASDWTSLIACNRVPVRVDEGRIADYLLDFEGMDHSGTFFQEVERLLPGHTLSISSRTFSTSRWYVPRAEPRAMGRADYEANFRDLLVQAVASCVGDGTAVGSMLSGGLDSSAVAALAATLPRPDAGALPVFSLVSASAEHCDETRASDAMVSTGRFAPHRCLADAPDPLDAELALAAGMLEEPFDAWMDAPRSAYALGARAGIGTMLDGIDGDTLLSEEMLLPDLLRHGRWIAARRFLRQEEWFYGAGNHRISPVQAARMAFAPWLPAGARRLVSGRFAATRLRGILDQTLINRDFAHRVGAADRLQRFGARAIPNLPDAAVPTRAANLLRPHWSAALGRYERVAFRYGIEPSHPFLDLRLVEFCAGTPDAVHWDSGFPKALLRHALDDLLPSQVAWRRGRRHLGSSLHRRIRAPRAEALTEALRRSQPSLDRYVDPQKLSELVAATVAPGSHLSPSVNDRVASVAELAAWVSRNEALQRSAIN